MPHNPKPQRCLDPQCNNKLLGGLLMHTVRKSVTDVLFVSGGVNVKSEATKGACSATRFQSLISACVNDPALKDTTVTGGDLSGIGNDAVFNA